MTSLCKERNHFRKMVISTLQIKMKKKVENGCFSVAEFKEDQNYGSRKKKERKKRQK